MNEKATGLARGKKVLFMLMPFWTPLIPPLGISCLKSYLSKYGYSVKTVDLNVEPEFGEIYQMYFDTLKDFIPEYRRGNFLNIGNNILRNHMMVHLNSKNEDEYIEAVQLLVFKSYYTHIDSEQVCRLNSIMKTFYIRVEAFLSQLMEAEMPDVLGISAYSGTLAPTLFAFKWAKERYPGIKTVMGGGVFADQLAIDSPNFKVFMEKTPFIDKMVCGEGEILMLKLLEGELDPEKRVHTLQELGGETLDISTAESPDFSDFDLQKYTMVASYASRSCPYQCSFCSETVQWGKYRKKPAARIVDELDGLYRKHGSQMILFGDSLLNPVVDDLSKELIERGLCIYWDGYLRADKPVCNPENTLQWRRGGFYRARLGVESGSEHVLGLMGKKITPEQIKSAVSSLAYAGIKTTTYWVIGHPGETEEDFQQTLDLIEEMKDDIYEAECNPFNYFPTGQVASDKFTKENEVMLLYPEKMSDMLLTQTWTLNTVPSREETYDRVCRFVAHCRKIGIPNPYSVREINEADERWRALHENAVPPLINFRTNAKYIDECKNIGKQFATITEDDGDFCF